MDSLAERLLQKVEKQRATHRRCMNKYLNSNPIQRQKGRDRARLNYYRKKYDLDNDDIYNSLQDTDERLLYIKYLREELEELNE